MFLKAIIYTLGEKIEFRSETYLEKHDGKIVNLKKDVKLSQHFLAEYWVTFKEKEDPKKQRKIRSARGSQISLMTISL